MPFPNYITATRIINDGAQGSKALCITCLKMFMLLYWTFAIQHLFDRGNYHHNHPILCAIVVSVAVSIAIWVIDGDAPIPR